MPLHTDPVINQYPCTVVVRQRTWKKPWTTTHRKAFSTTCVYRTEHKQPAGNFTQCWPWGPEQTILLHLTSEVSFLQSGQYLKINEWTSSASKPGRQAGRYCSLQCLKLLWHNNYCILFIIHLTLVNSWMLLKTWWYCLTKYPQPANTLQTINFVFSWTRTKKTSYHSSSSGIFSSGGTKQ